MNKLLLTPLSQQEEWTIYACLHAGVLFLEICKTPEEKYPNADLFCFYGYKFEAVCTGDGATVDSSSEFALLLSLQLGSHSILMAAEVDCCSDPEASSSSSSSGALNPGSFMELKTIK